MTNFDGRLFEGRLFAGRLWRSPPEQALPIPMVRNRRRVAIDSPLVRLAEEEDLLLLTIGAASMLWTVH